MRFSANTGFLWKELPFLERIARAAAAGFDALEFHDEAQGEDPAALSDALAAAGLPVLGLNTRMGDTVGCAAIPGAADQARRDFEVAHAVAERVGAGAIHVTAGKTDAAGAREAYLAHLDWAVGQTDRTLLIEPICRAAIPGYFLHDLDEAVRVIRDLGHDRIRIMFDCFHVETEHGQTLARYTACAAHVGHVQIASVPGRAEPVGGTLDYATLLPALVAAGYDGAFGCEYRPAGTVEEGLAWRDAFR